MWQSSRSYTPLEIRNLPSSEVDEMQKETVVSDINDES